MNINQIIDEMQASLTKLRGHFRLTGTAGECICPQVTLYPRGGMANEPISIDVDCPVHGKSAWRTKHPDLPLSVRVAKALGEKNIQWYDSKWMYTGVSGMLELIPDYPNDLVAAMGALEEYCWEGSLYAHIHYHNTLEKKSGKYSVGIAVTWEDMGDTMSFHQSFPQAICEAIVAHAEGK